MEVSLTPELEQFAAQKVASGEYGSISHVICNGLLWLKASEMTREEKLASLKEEIRKGMEGPYISAEEAFRQIREHIS